MVSTVFSCQSHITDLSTPEYWNWSRGSAANLSTSCAILLCSCLARATTLTSCEQIFCCMYCKSLEQNRTQWFKQTRLNLSTNAGNSVKIEPSLQQTSLLKTRRLSLIKIKFSGYVNASTYSCPFHPFIGNCRGARGLGKSMIVFLFVWKTKIFKRKINYIWESLPQIEVFGWGK